MTIDQAASDAAGAYTLVSVSTPGELIRVVREKRGISQTTLARQLGLSSGQSISNIERGVVTLPSVYILPVCMALGIYDGDLIDLMVAVYRQELLSEVERGNQNRH